MADLIEKIMKDSKVQDTISQIAEKHNEKPYATQSKTGEKALIQNNVFEQTIKLMV